MFSKTEIYNISNLLSFLRLLSAIPLWFLLSESKNYNTLYIILVISLFALVSDFLDGFFARKFKQITEVGKIIDPIADKVVTGVVVIKLFLLKEIPEYLFYMIIGRDIIIFLGGIFLSTKIGKVLPSNMIGKITVCVLALLLLMIILNFDKSGLVFQAVFFSTLILIIVSFIAYLFRAFEFIKKKKYESV